MLLTLLHMYFPKKNLKTLKFPYFQKPSKLQILQMSHLKNTNYCDKDSIAFENKQYSKKPHNFFEHLSTYLKGYHIGNFLEKTFSQ